MIPQLVMAEEVALPAPPHRRSLHPDSPSSCGGVQCQHVQPCAAPAAASPGPARTPRHAPPALTCVHSRKEMRRRTRHARGVSRRSFLRGLTLAGTAGLLGLRPRLVAAEPPPEVTTLRLTKVSSTCRAPQWIAEALPAAEGFTEVHYVPVGAGGKGANRTGSALVSGQVDLSMQFIGPSILQVDVGEPLVLLAGIQIGCYELFGTERV
jgi:hypothetical protein